MTETSQLTEVQPLGERHGMKFYRVNPSIPPSGSVRRRTRSVQVAAGGKAMIVNPGTGELLGQASVAYMEQEEVDPTRFVKLYLDGIRQVVGLTKAGLTVFELVYKQVQDKPGEDQVALSAYVAKEGGIEYRTYRRGLRELTDKQLLFASPVEGLFFINIRYLFNGNRLHFIKSYYKAGTAPPAQQLALGLDEGAGEGAPIPSA